MNGGESSKTKDYDTALRRSEEFGALVSPFLRSGVLLGR